MDTSDPPCDFDAFVAERYGITCDQAQQLIELWLTRYCPRNPRAVTSELEPNDESKPRATMRP